MVDRVYKADLPRLRNALVQLREDFARPGSTTDWTALRIEPLIRHAETLERLLESVEFSKESSRLRKGVVLFHSDLVYLRTNVKALREILHSEKGTTRKGPPE
jgi:hypothetical protein